MKMLNSIFSFHFSIPYSPVFTMINSSILHISYFKVVCTLNVFLSKFSSTSLTYAAGFSHYHTNKLANDILYCKSAWTLSLFLFIFLGHLTHFPLSKFSLLLPWETSLCLLLFQLLLWIFFFLIQKYPSPQDLFLGSFPFILCVILR